MEWWEEKFKRLKLMIILFGKLNNPQYALLVGSQLLAMLYLPAAKPKLLGYANGH
ncbi:hypothetical protein K450DRAFT_262719 [Umbelopsis ramanniana AG]|uniref:Uncharacterized protein n=1 Tax=Umbelopsis ramanniana AG TaxID=1314678 RepID=A0AAD5DZB0_UMBRA|nr:uncharacterized protein K450DRAFT_262719 [Umbelopsis ramanniana AG]KAI8575233.1 hypothetical protein K450DRAFT_262719 [Umbelopsis ramanniana AG]